MSRTLLITEALQQVKIITDRIDKKRKNVLKYVAHNSRFIDPLERSGGSKKMIQEEMQGVTDLLNELSSIRVAIQKKNLEINLTVGTTTKTVAEWLIWKRDLAPLIESFTVNLGSVIAQARSMHEKQVQMQPSVAGPDGNVVQSNLIVNVDEKALGKQQEEFSEIMGTLDAKLSILNATTSIEI